MAVVQQEGFDMFDFLGEYQSDEAVVAEVTELRSHLADYNAGKKKADAGAKQVAEAKKAIGDLFGKLPEEVKTVKKMETKTVANQLFAREEKIITIDGFNIIIRDKVNTKSPRDKFLKELHNKAAKAATPEAKAAYEDAIKTFEGHLDPTKGSELKIEPIAQGK